MMASQKNVTLIPRVGGGASRQDETARIFWAGRDFVEWIGELKVVLIREQGESVGNRCNRPGLLEKTARDPSGGIRKAEENRTNSIWLEAGHGEPWCNGEEKLWRKGQEPFGRVIRTQLGGGWWGGGWGGGGGGWGGGGG